MAWTYRNDADLLRNRDNPGDCEHAVTMYAESPQIATELGTRPLKERVLHRNDILKA